MKKFLLLLALLTALPAIRLSVRAADAPKLKDPSVEERLADLEAYVGNGARSMVANTNITTKIGGPGDWPRPN